MAVAVAVVAYSTSAVCWWRAVLRETITRHDDWEPLCVTVALVATAAVLL